MNANDVQLLTRMATDLATVTASYAELHTTTTQLAARVQALETGTTASADTTPIADILAKLEGGQPAAEQAATSAAQTAEAISAAASGSAEQAAPAEQGASAA